MKQSLLKRVNEQVKIQESAGKAGLDHIRDPKRVIGLHASGEDAYQSYIEGLDPNDPYDAKIIQRIASGN